MRVQIDQHTLERAEERGASEEEIVDVIEMGFDIHAKYGRRGKAKVYELKKERHGIYYEFKFRTHLDSRLRGNDVAC